MMVALSESGFTKLNDGSEGERKATSNRAFACFGCCEF